MDALIATRFSDAKQVGNTSTSVQLAAGKTYCERMEYKVVGTKSWEAESAGASNVKRIAELLEFCKTYSGKAQILMVFKLDRFMRDSGSHFYLKNELLKMGISLRSATETAVDDTPTGKLLEAVLAGIAEFDNSIKKERVTLAMERLLEQGIWPWKAPTGYKNKLTVHGKAGICEIDTACAEDIKRIFVKFATGNYSQSELRMEFNKKRVTDFKGRPIKLSKMKISRLLNNKFYMGLLEVGSWGKEYPGKHQPLISESVFNQCRQILSTSLLKGLRHLTANEDFPLRDRLYCDRCGNRMTAAWCTGRNNKKYAKYYCRNHDCTSLLKSVDKGIMESEFYSFLKTVRPTETAIEKFKQRVLSRYQIRLSEFETESSRLRKQLDRLETDKQRVIDMGKKQILEDEDTKQELAKVKAEINAVKLQLNECHDQGFQVEYLLEFAGNFLRNMHVIWNEVDTSGKIKIQRLIFPKGMSYKFPGFVETKLSPIFAYIKGDYVIRGRSASHYVLPSDPGGNRTRDFLDESQAS